MLPCFSSGMASPPMWLGKWSSPPQSLIQQLIAHLHMEHPKSNQLKKMALFPDHSCTFPALYLVSPGVRGFARSLVTHKCQQGLPDLLMPQRMWREASSTRASCLLSKQSLGLLLHGPPLVMGCSPECSSLLWSCASPICLITGLWLTCLHLLPADSSADGWYRRGL